jgi:hypothetical protein
VIQRCGSYVTILNSVLKLTFPFKMSNNNREIRSAVLHVPSWLNKSCSYAVPLLPEGTPALLFSTSQDLCNLVKSWASVPLPRFPRSASRMAEDGVQNLSAPGLRLCSRIGCASAGQSELTRPLVCSLTGRENIVVEGNQVGWRVQEVVILTRNQCRVIRSSRQ